MSYTGNEVVKMIDGLNSTRTLRRWTELAINLCGAKFNYDYMNVGQKNTHVRYLAYTKDDIQKFQYVASNKTKLGLAKTVIEVFKNEKQVNLVTLNAKVTSIVDNFQKIIDYQDNRIHELEQQKINLSQENYRLNKRIEKIEKTLENKRNLKSYWRERASP
ncbi:TPA: hypothetical protein ACGBG5_002541 [Enterococcus faecalis]